MSHRIWMPLSIVDYLADTGHLSAAEHGAYLLLIMRYWQDGGLPEDERMIARYSKLDATQWAESRDVLAAFFEDGWRHKRIEAEIAKAEDIISKRKSAAEQRYSKPAASAVHMQSTSTYTRVPPSPTPEPSKEEQKEPRDARSHEFETFWSGYPNKVGKPKARQSFNAARRKADFDAIMDGLSRYVASKPPDREWLNPTTFLNQERWNDQPAAPPVRAGPAPRINPTLAATRRLMERMNADTSSEIEADRTTARLVAYSVRSG